jgi:hypothetical protein
VVLKARHKSKGILVQFSLLKNIRNNVCVLPASCLTSIPTQVAIKKFKESDEDEQVHTYNI